jgi:hypothetical protein
MKSLIALAGLLMLLVSAAARADVTYDFIRLACVPEVGMLDVEYRGVHDTVAGDMHDGDMRHADALRQHGFYPARGLDVSCQLGQVAYHITARQGEASERGMCNADPTVYLTVTRNGLPVLRDVVFGTNCNNFPAVQRITFGDGPAIMRGPEASVCFVNTDILVDKTSCQWFFKKSGEFKKNFPIDQADVARRAKLLFKALGPSP